MHPDELSRYSKKDGLINACQTALRSGLKTEVSHISSVYELHPAGTDDIERMLSDETMKIIDSYNELGADIAFNIAPNTTYGFKCIPYLAMYFAPLVKLSGGIENFSKNLHYGEYVEDVKSLVKAGRSGVFSPAGKLGWASLISVTRSFNHQYEGRTVYDIAEELKLSHIDTVFELIRQDPYINVKEDVITYAAVEEFLSHEKAMVCLDGYIFDDVSTFGREGGIPEILPNPTGYCGFPLFLTKFNRFTLEEKIKKITGGAAQWYGINGRGFIREGMAADINVIDIDNLQPKENHINPMTYPTGITYVIVNGQIVVEDGSHIGTRSGTVLRKK